MTNNNGSSFFTQLSARFGSNGYRSFMQKLMQYLKAYGYFLQWTCKDLAKIPLQPQPGTMFLLTGSMVYNCDTHLLDYLESVEMLDNSRSHCPRDVPTFKWLLKRGLAETTHVFSMAIHFELYDVVDYCIKKRFSCPYAYRSAESLKMVKFLWKRNVTPVESVWSNGFYLSMDEDRFIWFLRYPEIEAFSFQKAMENAPFERRLDVLKWNAYRGYKPEGRYKNPMVIQILCENVQNDGDPDLPLDVCQDLPYEYAIYFDSDICECGDPANHENRKKPKNG